MSLRWRIALPFAALFAGLFVAVTFVAANQVSGAVERRLTTQAEKLAKLLSGSPGLETSTSLLGYIREAYDAEVALERGGKVAVEATTLSGPQGAWISGGRRLETLRQGAGELQEVRGGTQTYLVAYAPLGPDRGLLLLYDPAIVEAEKKKAVGPVLAVGGVGLFFVVLLAYVIAWTIARPVERLASTARRVSSGKLEVEIPPVRGGSEIDRLVEAFRNMLEGLRRYQENLLQSERLAVLGQMAAGVAHEIRNPLSAMKMTAQLLREEAPEDGREPYDVLLREIERLELAVSELFNAAHPSRLQKERVGLSELAEEVLALLRPQLEHLSIRVERRFGAESGVEIDRNVFKRALMNLILNGAQSMPQGGDLVVGTEGRNGRVRFFVEDAGRGIPEEAGKRIFAPFFTTRDGGVGLGLSVTKRIVEDHGGKIDFETSPKGSTFWIELPPA